MTQKENPFSGREKAIENLGGSTALYEKHLNKFKLKYVQADEELLNLLQSGNIADAEIMAHSIKGLSGTLGLTPLYHASANLEQTLKKGELPWDTPFQEFREKLQAVTTAE